MNSMPISSIVNKVSKQLADLMGRLGLNEEYFYQAILKKQYAYYHRIINNSSLSHSLNRKLAMLWSYVEKIEDDQLTTDYDKAKLFFVLAQKMVSHDPNDTINAYLLQRFNCLIPNEIDLSFNKALKLHAENHDWSEKLMRLQAIEHFFKKKEALFIDATAYREDMYAAFLLAEELLEHQWYFHVLDKGIENKVAFYKNVRDCAFLLLLVQSVMGGFYAAEFGTFLFISLIIAQPIVIPSLIWATTLLTLFTMASVVATVAVPLLLKHYWHDKHLMVQKNSYDTLKANYVAEFETIKRHDAKNSPTAPHISAQLPYLLLSENERRLASKQMKRKENKKAILPFGKSHSPDGKSFFTVFYARSDANNLAVPPSQRHFQEEQSSASHFKYLKTAMAAKMS